MVEKRIHGLNYDCDLMRKKYSVARKCEHNKLNLRQYNYCDIKSLIGDSGMDNCSH